MWKNCEIKNNIKTYDIGIIIIIIYLVEYNIKILTRHWYEINVDENWLIVGHENVVWTGNPRKIVEL